MSNILYELADWADAELSAEDHIPELSHYYWGYEGVSEKIRELARRYDERGSFSEQPGDTPLDTL